ncbi:MAG: hypothetical protein GY832_08465 [Chloroflexi bacterium]|nr:hypothetical protein [Chloroflexota bacterium]
MSLLDFVKERPSSIESLRVETDFVTDEEGITAITFGCDCCSNRVKLEGDEELLKQILLVMEQRARRQLDLAERVIHTLDGKGNDAAMEELRH